MSIDRKQLKSEAKQAMSAAKPSPYWVALAVMAIMLVLSILSASLDGTLAALRAMYLSAAQGQLIYVEPQPAGGTGWLLGLAVQVMSVEMSVGFMLYALRVWRRQKAGVGDLFDVFGTFFRAIWVWLLPTAVVSLWSTVYVIPVALLVVYTGQSWWALAGLPLLLPALVAMYSCRLTPYIMLDNPGMHSWQCLMLSRYIMRGHRREAFMLDMSFLGWDLLCLIPVAGQLLMVWVAVYQQVAGAGFYDRLMAAFTASEPEFPEF